MKTIRPIKYSHQAGVGVIEILIGMFIGLIGMLAMFSVISVADEQKRSVAAGGDAQAAAAIGLFRMERDIALAGNGFGNAWEFFGCDLHVKRTAGVRVSTDTIDTQLLPVSILTDALGHDSIMVFYGNASRMTSRLHYQSGSATSKVTDKGVAGFMPQALEVPGDVLLVTDETATACGSDDPTMVMVTAVTPAGTGGTVAHSGGTADGYVNIGTPPSPGFIYNLGPAPRMNLWAVNRVNGVDGLTLVDFLNNGGDGVIVAENIVDMQAQYGINTAAASAPPTIIWKHPTGPNPPTAEELRGIVAIKVAVLVRNPQWEAPPRDPTIVDPMLTMPVPTWSGAAGADGQAFSIQNPGDGTLANRYRYKVYEGIMPLRNSVWGSNDT
jgi:type IV pilus assembly protein PilW